MTESTVLITGANGVVGYQVIVHALRAGYRVKAAVRSQARVDDILSGQSIARFDTATRSKLSFVLVPDLLAADAYDEALTGCDYAIHVASPIPSGRGGSFEESLIKPAVTATMTMLEAAERISSVKRVVITSSVVGQLTWPEFNPFAPNDRIYNENSRAENPSGPYAHEGEAYVASKILALNAAEAWVKGSPRRIEVVHVHPAFVLGKVELATTEAEMLKGSSGRALAQVLKQPVQPAMASNTVHLDDVAEVHVRALDHKIPNGQSLVANSMSLDGAVWSDGREILQQHFPQAIEKGYLPGWQEGWAKTKIVRFDASETERLLDMKFKAYEEQLVDIVAWYLEKVKGVKVE